MSNYTLHQQDESIVSVRPRLQAVGRRGDISAKLSPPKSVTSNPVDTRPLNLAHIEPSHTGSIDHVSNISPHCSTVDISLEESSLLSLPPAKDQQEKDIPPHCVSCNLSSLAIANCISCLTLLCANCVIIHLEKYQGHHIINHGNTMGQTQQGANSDNIHMMNDLNEKLSEAQKIIHSVDDHNIRLSNQYHKAVLEVNKTYNFYLSMLAERKLEVVKEIEKLFSRKEGTLSGFRTEIQERTDKIREMVTILENLLHYGNTKGFRLRQTSLENKLMNLPAMTCLLDLNNTVKLEFISNFQAIEVGIRNQFGYIKSGSETEVSFSKQQPIACPIAPATNFNLLAISEVDISFGYQKSPLKVLDDGAERLAPPTVSLPPRSSKLAPSPFPPPNVQIMRDQMSNLYKLGVLKWEFSEPSGVAVSGDNEIIVVDTTKHSILVFNIEGHFKFQFGEEQLHRPSSVAVMASSSDIVVTEISPRNQVQVFTKYGHFIRKFGADILHSPRGVTTDCWGRIIVIECWVMRVVIFDIMGNVLRKFHCNPYLLFPNGVVVNNQEEIFISPEVVYSRMNLKVLETRQRDVSYSVIHGLYKNRDRLLQQGRSDDNLCQHRACKHSDMVETVEHIFCLCFRVRTAWLWLRVKVMELVSDLGPAPVVSNTELIMLMYPKCRREAEVVFLLGTYMELVDREVTCKQKELMVGTVRGVLRAKVEQLTSRAAPQINFPPGWT